MRIVVLVCLQTALLGVVLGALPSSAAVTVGNWSPIYVNNQTGSDDFDGRAAESAGDGKSGPLKTIMQAVRKCAVGARIEIANTGVDYRESVSIGGFKKGRADSPLIIDGHGAYVSGLVALAADQWISHKDDIYYFPNKVGDADFKPRAWYERKIGDAVYGIMPNSNWLGFLKHHGWFIEKEAPEIFFLNGKPGPNALKLEDIQPGGFFYDAQASILKEPAGLRCLFFRLPADKTLKECVVELPLNTGIFVSDDYVTVCNIGSRYSQDDGFAGFWGQGVILRNIHACFNCDQGVSFHGNSTTLIDGAMIERNAGCGIVDVMSCTTVYRNTTVRENYPGGVLFSGFAHAMYNCRIEDNCGSQIQIDKGASGSLVNCLIVGRGEKGGGPAVAMEHGRIESCTIVNSPVGVDVAVGASIRNSIIANCPTTLRIGKNAVDAVAVDKTILGLGEVAVDGQKINQAGWPEFITTHKRLAGAVIDSPALEGPLFTLPADSPLLKAGENGKAPGASLPPVKTADSSKGWK
jgi:hypothetical protein